jgi:pimeloyl-ACP methyl ester carboxylesterase
MEGMLGIKPLITTGDPFRHLIYWHSGLGQLAGESEIKETGEIGKIGETRELHVYLEGDGRPWLSRQEVAQDPTGRDLLALRLMARDPVDSIYVGRPCYHGFAADPGCQPWWWTHGRYSPEVVRSLVAAIRGILPARPPSRIVLIGYSGGGVLAILMAPHLEGVSQVITIAANLDIDAWADHHGYSPLRGSLNPARQAPLDEGLRQLHLIGDQDTRVPHTSLTAYLARNPKATLRILPGFDHRCCWVEQWPDIVIAPQFSDSAGRVASWQGTP